jgi:hypothetical protein
MIRRIRNTTIVAAATVCLILAAILVYRPQQAEASQTSASLSAAGAVTLAFNDTPPPNVATVQISGTFTGVTATIQGTADGVTWQNLSGIRSDTNVVEQTPTIVAGYMWKVDVTNLRQIRFNVTAISTGSITAQINASYVPVAPAAVPTGTQATVITASATGAAQANNASLSAVAGKTTYVTGFTVTGTGATAASVITVTVTGISPTLNYSILIPAGVTTAITTLTVQFPQPIPASATNTAVVVNCPSFGAGNTNASCSAYGFQQ